MYVTNYCEEKDDNWTYYQNTLQVWNINDWKKDNKNT
jgi:hypothetical protein